MARTILLSVCLLATATAVSAQTNLAAAAAGGRLVFFPSQYNDSDWAAANLNDGSPNEGWSGQSPGAQAFIFGFRDGALAEIEDVIVNPFSRESSDNWVREVEVLVSTTYPFRGYQPVGRLSLTAEGTNQVLTLDRPTPARYVKVVFLENGGGGYMQAGEIEVMGRLVPGAPEAPAFEALHERAKIESFTSEYNDSDWSVGNLLAADGVPGQWAGKSNGTQEVVVVLPVAAPVTDVSISNYARESDINWAREVEILLSPESSYKGFVSAGTLILPPVGDLHTLVLPRPTPARYVKVVFRRNGGGGYMEAGRIRIFHVADAGGASEITAQLDATGRAVTRDIRFDFDSAEILPDSLPALEEIASVLTAQPDLELMIEGHTDGVGTAEHNLDLSRRRAEAVKAWLVARAGIAERRLTTVGHGMTKPVAENATEEGQEKNRRVELVRKE